MNNKIVIRVVFLSVFLIAFFLSPFHIFAATISLQSSQNSLSQNDDYLVNATLSIGSSNETTYYLRGVFYQSGTNNYCGYTWNGSSYYNGPYTTNNGWQNLLSITVNNSSWSGTLKAKLDTSDSGCSNSGTYNFKIERYTTSGNSTFDSQNEQSLIVTIPTATATPAPTATNAPETNTPVPTSTPKSTAVPTSQTHSTVVATPTPLPSLVTSIGSISAATNSGQVLGSSISGQPTMIEGIQDTKKSSINTIALFLILGGILVLSSCGILFYYLWRKQKIIHEDNNE